MWKAYLPHSAPVSMPPAFGRRLLSISAGQLLGGEADETVIAGPGMSSVLSRTTVGTSLRPVIRPPLLRESVGPIPTAGSPKTPWKRSSSRQPMARTSPWPPASTLATPTRCSPCRSGLMRLLTSPKGRSSPSSRAASGHADRPLGPSRLLLLPRLRRTRRQRAPRPPRSLRTPASEKPCG